MSPDKQAGRPVFRVVDAMKAPYSGQILRVRLAEGKAPSLREIKGSRFRARSPDGTETTVRVENGNP